MLESEVKNCFEILLDPECMSGLGLFTLFPCGLVGVAHWGGYTSLIQLSQGILNRTLLTHTRQISLNILLLKPALDLVPPTALIVSDLMSVFSLRH